MAFLEKVRLNTAKAIAAENLYTGDQLDSYAVKKLGERDLVGLLEADRGGKLFSLATSYACIRIISTSIAGMPWVAQDFSDKKVIDIIENRPWRFMHPVIFREWLVASMLSTGNAYCIIRRNKSGGIIGFEPIMDGHVEPKWDEDPDRYGYIKYDVEHNQGGKSHSGSYKAEDILDFSGFCPNHLGKATSIFRAKTTKI